MACGASLEEKANGRGENFRLQSGNIELKHKNHRHQFMSSTSAAFKIALTFFLL